MKKLLAFLILQFSYCVFAFESVEQSKPGLYGSNKNVKCPIQIVPGKAIGPIELDRTFKEIESLDMEIKSVQNSKTQFVIGRYSVSFDDSQKVRMVEAEIGDLPHCAYFAKNKITPKLSAKKLAKIFKNCGKVEMLEGGNVINCEGISISTGGWGGAQKTPQLKIIR